MFAEALLWPGVMMRSLRAFRVNPGHGIWMLPQLLGVARKLRSGSEAAVCLEGTPGAGQTKTASVTG